MRLAPEASFRSGVVGLIVDSDFGDTVAMLVAIHGNRYGYRELKDYAKRIEDELRAIPNVAKLRRYGEQKEQIRSPAACSVSPNILQIQRRLCRRSGNATSSRIRALF